MKRSPKPAHDLESYRASCTRWLGGHGPRTAADLLATIPTDLGIDRYGDGGAVTALEKEICKVLGKPAAAFMPSGTHGRRRISGGGVPHRT